MPSDVRGRTRATLFASACSPTPSPSGAGNPLKRERARDRRLQLFSVNEEFLVLASHQLAGNPSLPFVHTARRYYRLSGLVRLADGARHPAGSPVASRAESDTNLITSRK